MRTPRKPQTDPDKPSHHPTDRRVKALDAVPPPDGRTPEQILADARTLEEAVWQTLAAGCGARTVVRLIKAEYRDRYEHEVIWQAVNRITNEWQQMWDEEADKERPRQLARLKQDLARMRGLAKPSFQAIARHEELVGRITGTFAPIKVKVDILATMKQSLAQVIVDLKPEDMDAMVAEQLELEARTGNNLQLGTAAE